MSQRYICCNANGIADRRRRRRRRRPSPTLAPRGVVCDWRRDKIGRRRGTTNLIRSGRPSRTLEYLRVGGEHLPDSEIRWIDDAFPARIWPIPPGPFHLRGIWATPERVKKRALDSSRPGDGLDRPTPRRSVHARSFYGTPPICLTFLPKQLRLRLRRLSWSPGIGRSLNGYARGLKE